jgi:Amt family ammonium transporter
MKSLFYRAKPALAGFATLLLSSSALAGDSLNSGDTAWVITATALVLLMTLPALALFYGGLVQSKNVLSVLMHCVAIACLASVLWLVAGYSLAFTGGDGGWIGSLDKAFLAGVTIDSMTGSIPEIVFFAFQMTFAIITPVLIVGAYPERMKFGPILAFSGLWLLLVYVPVTHWVWGGGWLAEQGVMDFAGGIVVHATAGASALVIAVMLGKRQGFLRESKPPHSPGLTMMGACLLWVGWYGFNGGSALAANGTAGMALTVTHLSAATASLVWMAIEWVKFGRPSMIGMVTGTIAGLATVTPGSGFIGPIGGVVYGAAGAVICFVAVQWIKHKLEIDDSLDVFAVHGVGGIVGTLLTAYFALESVGGVGLPEGQTVLGQLWVQTEAVVVTLLWSAIVSWIILVIIRQTVGLRVSDEDEHEGLDTSSHGEHAYEL